MSFLHTDVPRIRINAEHQRLMWLNFSPALIAGMLIFYLFVTFIGFDAETYLQDPNDFYQHISHVGKVGYGFSLLALIILLRNSIQNDIKSQFWDQLRMSSLSAWQMTCTRLFTAPILAWISVIISSAMATWGEYLIDDRVLFLSPFSIWLLYIFTAMILSSAILVNYLQFGRSSQEWQGSVLQCILLYFVITFYLQELPQSTHDLFNGFDNPPAQPEAMDGILGFFIIVLVYVGIGVWRSMSYKLHLRSSHGYWLIATLILPFVFALYYFIWLGEQLPLPLLMTIIYGVATIFSISVQDNRIPTLMLGLDYLKKGQLQKAVATLPAWVVLFGLCLCLLPVYAVFYNNGFFDYLAAVFTLIVYGAIVLFAINTQPRFNAITLALIWFLILRCLLFAFL